MLFSLMSITSRFGKSLNAASSMRDIVLPRRKRFRSVSGNSVGISVRPRLSQFHTVREHMHACGHRDETHSPFRSLVVMLSHTAVWPGSCHGAGCVSYPAVDGFAPRSLGPVHNCSW